MIDYMRGWLHERLGDREEARKLYARAARGPVEHILPHRAEEGAALAAALRSNPADAHGHLFLGNLLYAKGRRDEGIGHWRKAVEIDGTLVPAWRNLAYSAWHHRQDLAAALAAYETAHRLAPEDARVLLELDQVAEKMGHTPEARLARLAPRAATVAERDDLTFRWIDLLLTLAGPGHLEKARKTLVERHFHSWEGGYAIHHAWVEVHQRLAERALAGTPSPADLDRALAHARAACTYPKNLEVAPRTPDFRAHVHWTLVQVHRARGEGEKAREYAKKILAEEYHKPHLGTWFQALAHRFLGREDRAEDLLARLEKQARLYTSGRFIYRGTQETIGHILLALVLEARGKEAQAEAARQRALARDPRALRQAVREAQLDVSRAHQ